MLCSIAITGGRAESFDFVFSKGELSPNAIFDSATSPPGRYLLEVGRRTVKAAAACDALVIGNPILPMSGATLAKLALSEGSLPVPALICDEAHFPIAYALPRELFENGRDRFLNLLSTVSLFDARFLEFLTGKQVARLNTKLNAVTALPKVSPQGFVFDENPSAWKVQCVNAISLMERRQDWPSLPLAAHHPNHAGDVLFFSLASQLTKTLDYGAHVVCSSYVDIFHDCGNRLEPIVLDMAPLSRDGRVSDAKYFIQSIPHLPREDLENHFIVFSRFSKNYSATPFHLIDHARFALGDPISSFGETLYRQKSPPLRRCPLPTAPLRVLLQLSGGWPLKTYPEPKRRVLIQALRAFGCQVTVLDLEDAARDGAAIEQAGNTRKLSGLLHDHHIFVSVDSFPLHYACHVVGHPTVALFGPSSPSNSDAPRGVGYRLPLPSLPCYGCAGPACPINGKTSCDNYPGPEAILTAIFELADEVYEFQPTGDGK